MKSISIFLFFILASMSTWASNTYSMLLTGQNIMISTNAKNKSKFDITVKDAGGQVCFTQTYTAQTNAPTIKLNLSQLTEGNYEVLLSDEFKTQVLSFEASNREIKLSRPLKTFFKPIVKVSDKKVIINFFNQDNTAKLNILDSSNRSLFSESITSPHYGRQFNLSGAPAGIYIIEIVQNENYYTTQINIQ